MGGGGVGGLLLAVVARCEEGRSFRWLFDRSLFVGGPPGWLFTGGRFGCTFPGRSAFGGSVFGRLFCGTFCGALSPSRPERLLSCGRAGRAGGAILTGAATVLC